MWVVAMAKTSTLAVGNKSLKISLLVSGFSYIASLRTFLRGVALTSCRAMLTVENLVAPLALLTLNWYAIADRASVSGSPQALVKSRAKASVLAHIAVRTEFAAGARRAGGANLRLRMLAALPNCSCTTAGWALMLFASIDGF